MITVDDIRGLAPSLPGASERAPYDGRPSWRTTARIVAAMRDEPRSLVVWVASIEEKQALLAADPGTFSAIPHLDGHPIVLVDPEVIEVDEARELITDSWRLRAPRRLVDRSEQGRASGG